MWLYIHNDYLKLLVVENEVGSSAMPHKVNPIHFENAEGNLKIAAGMFHTIGTSICLSRLQRDLTDSTILRNVGTACGHMVLSIRNLCKGLGRVTLNKEKLDQDLRKNDNIFMEFYQLKLRKWNIANGYEICKSYSRGADSTVRVDFVTHLSGYGITLTHDQIAELNMDVDNIIKSM